MTAAIPGALNLTAAQIANDMLIGLGITSPVDALTTLQLLGQFLQQTIGNAAVTTDTLQSATIPVADITGAPTVNFTNTGVTPGNLQMPTAAAIVAAIPGVRAGYSYELNIRNGSSGANTLTLTTNTGITLPAGVAVLQNQTRTYVVTITNVAVPAVTLTSMGVSAAGV